MRDEATVEAATTELLARSVLYGACSEAFAYPTTAQLERLSEEDLPLAVALAPALGDEPAAATATAAEAFAGRTVAELEAAHREVFSHVHAVDCPPYETDYTAKEVWRQTQELADLSGFYRAFGLEQVAERPDSIAVELEFLHALTYKRLWAVLNGEPEHAEVCLGAEEAFLREHVLRWAPGFAGRVAHLAGDGPYHAAAGLLLALLRIEARSLRIPIDEATPEPVPAEPPGPGEGDVGFCEEAS